MPALIDEGDMCLLSSIEFYSARLRKPSRVGPAGLVGEVNE